MAKRIATRELINSKADGYYEFFQSSLNKCVKYSEVPTSYDESLEIDFYRTTNGDPNRLIPLDEVLIYYPSFIPGFTSSNFSLEVSTESGMVSISLLKLYLLYYDWESEELLESSTSSFSLTQFDVYPEENYNSYVIPPDDWNTRIPNTEGFSFRLVLNSSIVPTSIGLHYSASGSSWLTNPYDSVSNLSTNINYDFGTRNPFFTESLGSYQLKLIIKY